MEEKYSPEMAHFLAEYLKNIPQEKNLKSGNDKMMHAALLYEKFRTSIEYKEEHLVLKNAISRILRRRCSLTLNYNPEHIFNDLMSELSWADYINPEIISEIDNKKLKKLISTYLPFLKNAKSRVLKKYDIYKIILDWLAVDIDQVLANRQQSDNLVDFAYSVLKNNIKKNDGSVLLKDEEITIKLVILNLIYRPDYAYAQRWLVKNMYQETRQFNENEAVHLAKNFDKYYFSCENIIHHPLRKKITIYLKKSIAPFILIRNLAKYEKDLVQFESNPRKFANSLVLVYQELIKKMRQKVWRATFRSLIFIFLTKLSLAFLIELPADKYLKGGLNLLPFVINIALPPFLMLFSGISIRMPSVKNRQAVTAAIYQLVFKGKIESKQLILDFNEHTVLEKIFNIFYVLINIAIVMTVIYLLRSIGFSLINLILFFIFVSAVSFFSFRIRNIVLELNMRTDRESFIFSVIDLIFMPFVQIGKVFSAVLTKSNPFIITLDYLIEAPLKTIIHIFNSWFKYIRKKKEDIDL